MGQETLRQAILEFVALVDSGSEVSERNEEKLRVLVDRLALAISENAVPFEFRHYEGGDDVDYAQRRKRVCAQFSDFGYYNVPASITQDIADTEIMVGDATDDIVDITSELAAVLKVWDSQGEAKAIRALAAAYWSHLADHLRDLQRYLHARLREGKSPPHSPDGADDAT